MPDAPTAPTAPTASTASTASTAPNAIVLFDGVCNLCSATVQFIVARDRRACFRFASLQSEIGRELLAEHGITDDSLGSVTLIEGGRVYRHSNAVLRIARRLDPPWPVLYAAAAIPRPLRDALYRFIARHRYRWFGRRDSCMMPSPQLRSRFL